MKEEVMVSVLCITYNHENYIEQCLENILNQKTSFKYEIIVHDDASTDSTSQIIAEMQKRHPDKIRPILQKENQFSQGHFVVDIAVRAAKGKYLAFCEGDDYWCDDQKLQKQYDYMEDHEDCAFCFHDTYTYYVSKQTMKEGWYYWSENQFKGPGVYTINDMMNLQKVPYASLFHRRCDHVFKNELGELHNRKVYIDILKAMLLADRGYGFCLPGYLSVYRYGTAHSLSSNWMSNTTEYNLFLQNIMNTWGAFNHYTHSLYKDFVKEQIERTSDRQIELQADSIKEVSKKCGKLYIYGTGVYGAICMAEMKKLNIDVEGFLVSDGIQKEESYYEKPVYFLSEITGTDVGIIIAAGKKARPQIIENLKKNAVTNKYCIGLQEMHK